MYRVVDTDEDVTIWGASVHSWRRNTFDNSSIGARDIEELIVIEA